MKQKHYDALEMHYNHYFQVIDPEKEINILHPMQDDGFHVDIAIYAPNKNRSYKILATMGASDYAMKGKAGSLSNRNEFITFVPADWDYQNEKDRWLCDWLSLTANYARLSGEFVTYSHTLDMSQVIGSETDDDFNMTAVQIMFPQAIEDAGVLRAKLGLIRKTAILHMMPLTEAELHMVREGGDLEAMMERIYGENAPENAFLSVRKR